MSCLEANEPVAADTCCCNHGGRCTCAHKKETPLDTVPESDSEDEMSLPTDACNAKPATLRRRANTVHSDASLFFDQNGHHKPSAKFNRATHKAGPYQLNRVNSANSAGSLGASAENLLMKGNGRSCAGSSREPRKVKSEAASPLLSGTGLTQMNGNLPPLDLSNLGYSSCVGSGTPDLFSSGFSSDIDAPIYSAGLSAASVDWSHYDLGDVKAESFAPSSYSQAAQSYNGILEFSSGSEQLPHLANTTSTSGDVSEVEDFMAGGDGDLDNFGGNSFFRQNNMLNSADLSTIDYDSFTSEAIAKGADSNLGIAGSTSQVEEDPAFWVQDYATENTLSAMDESQDGLAPMAMGNFWEA